jgi:hypothetical protein
VNSVLLVVEKVVGHVIACVSENATAVCSQSCMPIPEDDCVCELPKGCSESDKQSWRHDKPVLVHREVVVNAVKEEMQGDADAIVRQMPVLVSISR